MALISCPECGKEVSDKAVACPNCGYPIASQNQPIDETTKAINAKVKEYVDIVRAEEAKGYMEMLKVWTVGIDIDIACPRCGKHHYTLDKQPNGKRSETVLWCDTGRGEPGLCMGKVCYCDNCKKWYSETMFTRHDNAFECMKCGTIQREYTATQIKSEQDSRNLARILGR